MSVPETDAEDRADMGLLVAGRESALNSLMDRHAGALFGFLCRFVRDEEAARDLAQETFVRVFQNRAQFDPHQRFSTWLFTIGANLARNHLRSRSRHPEESLEANPDFNGLSLGEKLVSPGDSPEQHAQRMERQEAVRAAVAGLSEDLREAVLLCELEDRSITEAARILSTTGKAVESRLYRARQKLRSCLSAWL
jgi:RNA polymerase sigma-70 factor (ECF subfamily)